MKQSKQSARVSVGLVLLVAAAAAGAACGSPDWQNQYTEQHGFTAAATPDAAPDDDAADSGSPGCASDPSTCKTPLSVSPSASSPVPVIVQPQGNPDPVPWAIHPILVPRQHKYQ